MSDDRGTKKLSDIMSTPADIMSTKKLPLPVGKKVARFKWST